MSLRSLWRSLPVKKRRAVFVLVPTIFVTSNLLGWQLGKLFSPDYESELAAEKYILASLQMVDAPTEQVAVMVTAGFRTFTYSTETDKVVELLPRPDLSASHFPKRNMSMEGERLATLLGISAFVAPAGAIGLWKNAKTLTSGMVGRPRLAVIVASGAIFLTGGGLGFWAGFRDSRAWDSPMFLKGLRNPDSWRPIVRTIHSCKIAKHAATLLATLDERQDVSDSAKGKPAQDACDLVLLWASKATVSPD